MLSYLIKIAAKKKDDINNLINIFNHKYPNEYAVPGLAIQYYKRFIKGNNTTTTLTKDNLPQPLPKTIEELKLLLSSVEVDSTKSKKEELKESLNSKYPDINLVNINEDYLLWLHLRYVLSKANPDEIVHPIEEALETLKKFPSIQDKYKASPEFKKKVNEAGYPDISSVKNLTLDDMENISALDTSGLSIRVEGVEIKKEEFLGKFGEWNLWIPHTQETSAKIAGYDENYVPETTWCTARTKGSNLFYNYIGRKDIPLFLFYIIKDNPEKNNDWLSIGYISQGSRLSPDFRGNDGGLSVNRKNKGLEEGDYYRILGENWNSIKYRIESEIEKYKIMDNGEERYISPARYMIERLAKNAEEFKGALDQRSSAEKKDFIKIILDADPSAEVMDISAENLSRIDSEYFIRNLSDKPWAKKHMDKAAKIFANNNSQTFLTHFSTLPWAKDYIDDAAKILSENNPMVFINYFIGQSWAKKYLGKAAEIVAETNSYYFIRDLAHEPWAKDHIGVAAKIFSEEKPFEFMYGFSNEPWAKDYLDDVAEKYINDSLRSNNLYSFLYNFSNKPWAKDHIDVAAKLMADKKPDEFMYRFSNEPWAKNYLDLAKNNIENRKELLFGKEGSNAIEVKLLKLSNILKYNNLEEYKYVELLCKRIRL